MSESATSAEIFEPYCQGLGLELGFGGFKSVKNPMSLTFDQKRPYTSVGEDKQIFQGDCRDLNGFTDGSLSHCTSAHLLEDFEWPEIIQIIKEWRRCLAPGGYLSSNCPCQKTYLAHCHKTGQDINQAHKIADFNLETFKANVLPATGPWNIILEVPKHGAYSWLLILQKPL